MATLKDKLDAFDGQPEQGWNKRRSVSVGERGQVYRANFAQEYLSAVYAIDGGIIKDLKSRSVISWSCLIWIIKRYLNCLLS